MKTPAHVAGCRTCGLPLSSGGSGDGLCPACLLELALAPPPPDAEIEAEATTAERPVFDGLTPWQVLGGRYRIRSQIGRGGMGEVWRAWDLKLRVDVALKALRPELLADERAMRSLRREVRFAREVNCPHVCRVFDLIEVDGRELLSMEYIDGERLLDVLERRAPLELNEAREIAAQFLAGLEAIHTAGLVHRDIKPENIMVTRSGRVVVMDLGIAKGIVAGKACGLVGTPPYMAPEQASGGEVTRRTDLFSAGVVLAEMIAPGGLRSREARQAVWAAVHADPPRLPDSPWAGVIASAVARWPESRPASALSLLRSLEAVTQRVAGCDDLIPYPGLSAFTSEDTEYFFGREVEVETAWKRLQRAHLMALVGPSGAGKSSFVSAGLLPTMPSGWRALVMKPGEHPMSALARALVGEMSGDPEAVEELLRFEEPGVAVELMRRWRRRHREALLVIDQFEELFVQNPPRVQAQFAELLSLLALEADVHVLLSMRDDFLFHCSGHEALVPIFSEMLPLRPLTGAGLRRALVQPALKCGYHIEDDGLVAAMVDAVQGERGALPLLAFAASRMWSQRDRERGLLTREAYASIGGVAGALARHAEETLDVIGREHEGLVRELFRNLTSSQSTRATRGRRELLSVFDPARRREAGRVLDALIDARLLTSYEIEPGAHPVDGDAAQERHAREHHLVEVVHESLLTAWPRLVRWQSQDSEGAILRDQLRQAALLWRQRGRPEDLLWTGTSYREYKLWRERYSQGLSHLEEEFAQAMRARTERNRRWRRTTVAASFALLAVVLAAVGWGWRESEIERLEAEAAELLAIGRERLHDDPTEALAFTTASLEVADSPQARVFAVRVLAGAPAAFEVDLGLLGAVYPSFSPDGARLAVGGLAPLMRVVTGADGNVIDLPGHDPAQDFLFPFWASDSLLATGRYETERDNGIRIWRFPGGEPLRTIDVGSLARWSAGRGQLLVTRYEDRRFLRDSVAQVLAWNLPDGDRRELGTVDFSALGNVSFQGFSPDGTGLWYLSNGEVHVLPLPVRPDAPARFVGRHGDGRIVARVKRSGRLWTSRADETGPMLQWDLESPSGRPLRVVPRPPGNELAFWIVPGDADRWIGLAREQALNLWGLDDVWPEARALQLRRRGSSLVTNAVLHPRGDWLVATTHANHRLTFWPLPDSRPLVVEYAWSSARPVAFSPDGRWIATAGRSGVTLRPLPGSDVGSVKVLRTAECPSIRHLEFDSGGRFLLITGPYSRVCVVPLDGSAPTAFVSGSFYGTQTGGAVSPSGRVAAIGAYAEIDGTWTQTVHVWDLESGEHRMFSLPPPRDASDLPTGRSRWELAFQDDSTLFVISDGVLRRWNLESGDYEILSEKRSESSVPLAAIDAAASAAIVLESEPGAPVFGTARVVDLANGEPHDLALSDVATTDPTVHWLGNAAAFSNGVIAVGDGEGVIRVAWSNGGEAHLLVGHEGPVVDVAISPDGRWIASSGEDRTLRLWPMPNLAEAPLQALPREELIARLRSLTNIRVDHDPDAPAGWRTYLDAFPGWAKKPRW